MRMRREAVRERGYRWIGVRVLLVAAVVFCGWSAWAYWQADHDDTLAFGRTRDAALAAGRREIATLNSLDGAKADAGLRRWLDASTGPLHDELRRSMDASKKKIEKAETSAKGTVTDIAVTELDARAGTAKLIATVRITVTPKSGAARTDRKRFEAGMARTAEGWKLKSLLAVPAGAR